MSYVWDEIELGKALGISIPFSIKSGKVDFNSKDINPSDIFIALKGAVRDGHEFGVDAIKNGASAVIVSRDIGIENSIKVDDTEEALIKMASYKRENSAAKFIGITGSVGKTSTKEYLGAFLSYYDKCFFNKGNFNNHIGVPLSLASLPINAKYSVNEMGMNNAGEIRELANLVRPDIAIITIIGEAHLENLGSIENICKAKCEIFEGLDKNGTAIINIDSQYYELQRRILTTLGIKNIRTFGENDRADCRLVSFETKNAINIVKYQISGKILKTENHLPGKHHSLNIAAALLAVDTLGLDIANLTNVIKNIPAHPGRGVVHELYINDKKVRIIDDAYNANPTSVRAALESIRYDTSHKVAILADMKELGSEGDELHRSLAPNIMEAGITQLHAVGKLMKNLHDEVKSHIQTFHYNDSNYTSFDDIISKIPNEECIILVKGSKSTKIREFVSYIMNKYGKKT